MLKKVVGWIVVAFLVYFVVSRPAAAATAMKGIGGVLIFCADGFGTFFTGLVS